MPAHSSSLLLFPLGWASPTWNSLGLAGPTAVDGWAWGHLTPTAPDHNSGGGMVHGSLSARTQALRPTPIDSPTLRASINRTKEATRARTEHSYGHGSPTAVHPAARAAFRCVCCATGQTKRTGSNTVPKETSNMRWKSQRHLRTCWTQWRCLRRWWRAAATRKDGAGYSSGARRCNLA
jgi:hypothetical protein